MRFIAADLGGSSLRCAVGDAVGQLSVREAFRLTYFGTRGDALGRWRELAHCLGNFGMRELRTDAHAPIFLAFPGALKNGIPSMAPTVTGSAVAPDVAAIISAVTSRPCIMINDVSAAAWFFAGKWSATERFGVVTVSSGIGFKIFDRSSSLGVRDDAGEIGHLVVDEAADAPICDCGGRGHLSAFSSGRAVERRARAWASGEAKLTNESDVVPAIQAGDSWALALLRDSAMPLARVLTTVIVANGLERVAIMGGFAQALGPAYLEAIRGAVASQAMPGPAQVRPESFILAEHHEEPSLQGIAIFGARSLAA